MNVVIPMRLIVGLYSTARAILDTHMLPLSWFARLLNLDRYLLEPNCRAHTPLHTAEGKRIDLARSWQLTREKQA
jgi:hypothetical protein